jgi:lactate permease
LIWAFAGFRGMLEIWPAILVAGIAFAVPQFLVSNFHGPWLVDVVAAFRFYGNVVALPEILAAEKNLARVRSPTVRDGQPKMKSR